MDTNCAPLIADFFFFCYERDFIVSLSGDTQTGVIKAFNSVSRYLDGFVSSKNYDERDDFDWTSLIFHFYTVIFPAHFL